MSHTREIWVTKDDLSLYAQYYTPEKKTKAVICLIHGHGEHSKRYEHVANAFLQNNIATITFDLRGHGRSQGKRGHIKSYNLFLDDVTLMLQKAQELFPNIPVFLYGHSMGGNIALNYALKYYPKLAGVIATSPWLKLTTPLGFFKTLLSKIMGIFWPSYTEERVLPLEWLSTDPKVGEMYDYDALCHGRISAGLYNKITKAGKWDLKNADTFSLPLLLMHGSGDKVTSPKASIDFANRCSSPCTLKIWDNLYHELHNEKNQTEIIQYMIDWINSTLKETPKK